LATVTQSFNIEEHTAGDGYVWRYRRYSSAGPAKAQVICLHGIQSHGGWYEYSCTRLSQASFAVTFLDRRGSGLNEQARGDTPSFRRLIDDVAEFLLSLRSIPASGSPLPVFLLGISWGAKVAVALQRQYPGLIEGLILLCPGVFPKIRPRFSRRLAIAGARLVSPQTLFSIPLNDPELFTANARWHPFIRDDPRSLRRATGRLLVESARLDGYLRFVPPFVRVPVLLLLAEEDRIIDNARTRAFVDRFASTDIEIIEYPGAHHTLEFEPDPDRFIADLLRWLEQKALAIAADNG
jgi:alpha-beta hydrolase superfamily lysophospholipase